MPCLHWACYVGSIVLCQVIQHHAISYLFLNCLRIATILTSERSTDGVSRLLSKADLERLKLEKAKPLAKVAECLGLDFFLASHWVQNLQAKCFFFNGNNDCITEGVVARLVVNDEKDL